MATERIREVLTTPLTQDHLQRRAAEGWQLIAVEWQRPSREEPREMIHLTDEIPYGLQVAADCASLENNAQETRALILMLELMIQEVPYAKVAEELNRQGYRTRVGTPWGPVAVFNMLPRLIEVGPMVFPTDEWAERRQQLFKHAMRD